MAAGRRDELLAFLTEAIPFYEQPGGIRVRVLWDMSDGDRFNEVIEYADQATHDRDQVRVEQDPVMGEYLHRWRALLEAAPQIDSYRVGTPRRSAG